VEEALGDVVIARELGAHQLQRDLLAKLEVRGGRDDAHPADPDDPVDAKPSGDHIANLHGRQDNRRLLRMHGPAAAWFIALAACGAARSDPRMFGEQPLATAPGLSGLAVDERGDAWAVAERARTAYRISGNTVETLAIENVPDGHDLEAIVALGGDRFAFGTEGKAAEPSRILFAHRDGTRLMITETMLVSAADAGVPEQANHGIEGLCGDDRTLAAALESVGTTGGKRWAPVLQIEAGAVVRAHRLWLTTATGKLSALDCRRSSDGRLDVLAIERHFEVTRILRFTLGEAIEITPRIALDLGATLRGRLNLEGIAWLPNGDVVAVTDNQWKAITGPSLLLRLRSGSVE
jgi:hypothetical protein